MDPRLYRAGQEGNWDVISIFGSQLYSQQTPDKNTVLHVVAEFCDSSSSVYQILNVQPKLLLKLNAKGETSLHIAAREGRFNIVRALNDCAKQKSETDWTSMLTSRARNGNSVLHEAVNNNRHDIVQFLLQEYPSLILLLNYASESPLYVAVEKGYEDLAALILSTCKSHPQTISPFYRENRSRLCTTLMTHLYDGPGSRTALHAAAQRNSRESVKLILEQFPKLTKRVDEHGWTPLHHAARFNNQGVAKTLLISDPSAAYVKSKLHYIDLDKDGKQTALHVAVAYGHVQMMEELLLQCPDCWEMVTEKRKNVIHLSVENEQQEALEFILMKSWATKLINEKDSMGNTPLHLYATTMKLRGYNLINHPQMEKNVVNHAGLTPLDLIIDAIEHVKDVGNLVKERQIFIKNQLERAGAMQGYRNVVSMEKDTEEPDEGGPEHERTRDTYLVVATLIVTVTFAAAFTIPGGYESSDGQRKGMAVLAKKAAFLAFIATDVSAMMFSLFTMGLLLMPSKKRKREKLLHCAQLIGLALVALIISFSTGLYVAIPTLGIRILLFVFLALLGCMFLLFCYFHNDQAFRLRRLRTGERWKPNVDVLKDIVYEQL